MIGNILGLNLSWVDTYAIGCILILPGVFLNSVTEIRFVSSGIWLIRVVSNFFLRGYSVVP